VFANANPVEIEVGFGKGLFLVRAAQSCPGVNFVGVEISRKYQLFTATRLAKRALTNVRLAKGDARGFLRDRVLASSVQAIHVYFPDPWWKKRHLKRRVFVPDFVIQCERVLMPSGKLHIATDVEAYFAVITALMARHSQMQPTPAPGAPEAQHDLDYLTNFERKFRIQGRPIYRAIYDRHIE
jgi:tRNA (guanine-N7-)-methyltransferase